MWDVGILVCFADQRLYFVTQIEKLFIYIVLCYRYYEPSHLDLQRLLTQLLLCSRGLRENVLNAITCLSMQIKHLKIIK